MTFDMGWDFRSSATVTDPAYAVPGYNETYPHTYTNSNGDSINAGWTVGISTANRNTGVDPRLAGINYSGTAGGHTFTVDLSSGSAPGAGTYTIDLAAGDYAGSHNMSIDVKDTSTGLISFSGTTGGANQYFDATGTNRSPGTSSWDLVRATTDKTFATTTVNLIGAPLGGDYFTIAHFRLTLQGGASQSVVPVLMAQYRARG